MRKTLNWLMVSGVAVGCFAMCAVVRGQAAAPAAGANASAGAGQTVQTPALALPAGAVAAKESADATKLGGSLETATEDALKGTGRGGIITCFVEQDRNRMKEFDKIDSAQLNAQGEQIAKAWKDKYNEKFAFDAAKVFTSLQAVQGEIQDPQQFVQNWPVPVVGGAQGEAQQAAAKTQQLDDDAKKEGFIDKGRDIAIVRIPAEGNLPALDVSLIKEAHGWKIDVPNGRTAQQIHDDLEKHLTMLGSDPTKWPADADQARRAFVGHVIMAIYGVDAQPAPAAAQPAQ